MPLKLKETMVADIVALITTGNIKEVNSFIYSRDSQILCCRCPSSKGPA